jgi:hypothetical protein
MSSFVSHCMAAVTRKRQELPAVGGQVLTHLRSSSLAMVSPPRAARAQTNAAIATQASTPHLSTDTAQGRRLSERFECQNEAQVCSCNPCDRCELPRGRHRTQPAHAC